MTLALLAIVAITLAVADHISGTAFYQKAGNTMDDQYFDFADDDGSTGDYWAAYLASVEDDMNITGNLPLGLVAGDDDLVHFQILTDEDLAAIDEDVDNWPDEDISQADWLWFLSGGQTEEDGAYIED